MEGKWQESENGKLERRFIHMLAQNGMRVWEIDLRRHEIIDYGFAKKQGLCSGEKNVIPDVPESIIAREVIHQDDEARCREWYRRIYNGEDGASVQLRAWVAERQEYVWQQITATLMYDENGEPMRALCSGRDISEIKQLERRFAEETRYWEEISGSILATGRRNLATGTWEEVVIHGMAITLPEEIRRTTDYRTRAGYFLLDVDISQEDDEKLAPEYLIGEYARGVRNLSFEYNARTIERSEPIRVRVDCSLRKRPDTGELIAFYYERDITQEFCVRSIMESIMKYEYDLVGVLFAASNSIYSKGKEDATSLPRLKSNNYNEVCAQFMREYACGDNVEEVTGLMQLDYILERLKTEDTYIVEFDVREPNGQARRKELRYAYISREEQLIAVSRRDVQDIVTKEKEKQEALETALNIAEHANLAKSEFLSRMSHEMRTPMNAIMGLVSLAGQEVEKKEVVLDYLEKIKVSSRLLMNLINDVLDMAKIESGKMELHEESCSFGSLVEGIETVISPLCEQNGINFVLESDKRDECILVDKLRFQQVFLNLLSNAIKFTPEGGSIYFKCRSRQEGARLAVEAEVADSGMGMSEEFQKRMFEPFTQEERAESASVQGTGLGLAITKAILDKMGGTIQVDSHLGHGTRFVIQAGFPLVQKKKDAYTDMGGGTEQAEDMQGRTILLVEDHPMNQLIARRILQNNGAKVVTMDNGEAAVNFLREQGAEQIDAVLMDVRMPVMDGITATKLIRRLPDERTRKIPIIAMTANAFEEDVQKTREAGMNFHLAKPIEPTLLLQTLHECIDRHYD